MAISRNERSVFVRCHPAARITVTVKTSDNHNFVFPHKIDQIEARKSRDDRAMPVLATPSDIAAGSRSIRSKMKTASANSRPSPMRRSSYHPAASLISATAALPKYRSRTGPFTRTAPAIDSDLFPRNSRTRVALVFCYPAINFKPSVPVLTAKASSSSTAT